MNALEILLIVYLFMAANALTILALESLLPERVVAWKADGHTRSHSYLPCRDGGRHLLRHARRSAAP